MRVCREIIRALCGAAGGRVENQFGARSDGAAGLGEKHSVARRARHCVGRAKIFPRGASADHVLRARAGAVVRAV